jgi:hypothetical protein
MELKVRLLDGNEEESLQDKEIRLAKEHEAQLIKDTEDGGVSGTNSDDDELEEEKVLSYLGKKLNREVKSFDEFVGIENKSEDIPEDVQVYLKYKKETGRGFDDFLKLNKNFDEMDSGDLLRKYYVETQEGLDEEDIDVLVEEFSYDEDLDEKSVIDKKKIEKKREVAKAKSYFNSLKEKYKTPLESSTVGMSEEAKNELDSYRNHMQQAKTEEEVTDRKRAWFFNKTEEVFNKEFKGFEFNVNNQKLVYSPGDAEELKRIQSTPENFIKKFLNKDGLIEDANGYHRSLAIAMNPDKFAKHFYEQGLSDATEGVLRKQKNIQMSERKANDVVIKGGISIRELAPESGRGLKIRSAKKV